jgi:very-short-patch-repair endonuclease
MSTEYFEQNVSARRSPGERASLAPWVVAHEEVLEIAREHAGLERARARPCCARTASVCNSTSARAPSQNTPTAASATVIGRPRTSSERPRPSSSGPSSHERSSLDAPTSGTPARVEPGVRHEVCASVPLVFPKGVLARAHASVVQAGYPCMGTCSARQGKTGFILLVAAARAGSLRRCDKATSDLVGSRSLRHCPAGPKHVQARFGGARSARRPGLRPGWVPSGGTSFAVDAKRRVTEPAPHWRSPGVLRALGDPMQHSSKYSRSHQALVARRAVGMRSALTPPEAALWAHLRSRQLGVWFRRAVVIGPCVADLAAIDETARRRRRKRSHAAHRCQCPRASALARLGWRVLRVPGSARHVAPRWPRSLSCSKVCADSRHLWTAADLASPCRLGADHFIASVGSRRRAQWR